MDLELQAVPSTEDPGSMPAPPTSVEDNASQHSDMEMVTRGTSLPSTDHASLSPKAANRERKPSAPPLIPHPHSFLGPPSQGKSNGVTALTLNQQAIVIASQNKLPISCLKGIVTRLGRHTQSSGKKLGHWYKGDNYVDNANYSWRNMALFFDYQKQMYASDGTIKTSCKK